MSYTPINWQTGQTITAEKLNKMDNGWSVQSTIDTCFDGTVESRAMLTLTSELSTEIGATATITFDGTPYSCTCFDDDGVPTYGAPYEDYTTYPFNISYGHGAWGVIAEDEGTHTLKIEATTESLEVGDDFQSASRSAVESIVPLMIIFGGTTWQQAYDAMTAGRMVYCIESDNIQPVIHFDTSAYSVTCLAYGNGLTTTTYRAGSASGTFMPL